VNAKQKGDIIEAEVIVALFASPVHVGSPLRLQSEA
jgi:hypothetical protein